MKKYQELEQQAKEMLAKVEEIQKEIGRLKEEEVELFSIYLLGKATKLPSLFNRKVAIDFLEDPDPIYLNGAFTWSYTSQGCDYWNEIYRSLERNPKYKVPDEAIIQIQKWVIQSYKEQYGS